MKMLTPILIVVAIAAVAGTLIIRSSSGEPLATVDHVDLDRFMGDWYVIANIPTFIEKGAHNAIESYQLNDDGTVDTVFTFHAGSFSGEPKRYNPKGFILNSNTNAEWGMQFIWPVKADYRIIYLDPEYQVTVIGRNRRDYVWIMAREPSIDSAQFDAIVRRIGESGYDISKLQRVPQQW